jgi:uncharacterized protein (UPF0276 family)
VPLPLGVGLVYTPGLEPLFETGVQLVEVLELEPQTQWRKEASEEMPYRHREEFLAYLADFPQQKIVHGVGFPVGGSRQPDHRHIPLFTETIDSLGAIWASEHLAFNQARGPDGVYQTGFFLPPLQSHQGIACAVNSIQSLQSLLSVPFAVETGTNYLKPREGEIDDGAFVEQVVTKANCGILLDLHNIWANEQNGRQTVAQYLAQLPLERVWELHFAGGFEYRGYWLDAHSGVIPDAVVELAAELIPDLPNLGAIVFELMPSFLPQFGLDKIVGELEKLHALWALRTTSRDNGATENCQLRQDRSFKPNSADSVEITPEQWEDSLGALVARIHVQDKLSDQLSLDPAIHLLQELIGKFRAGAVTRNLRLTIRLLFLSMGDETFQRYLIDYFKSVPPQPFAGDETACFAQYLREQTPEVPGLLDILGYDLAAMEVASTGEPREVPFSTEPLSFLAALEEGELPEWSKTHQRFLVTITCPFPKGQQRDKGQKGQGSGL